VLFSFSASASSNSVLTWSSPAKIVLELGFRFREKLSFWYPKKLSFWPSVVTSVLCPVQSSAFLARIQCTPTNRSLGHFLHQCTRSTVGCEYAFCGGVFSLAKPWYMASIAWPASSKCLWPYSGILLQSRVLLWISPSYPPIFRMVLVIQKRQEIELHRRNKML